MAVLSIAVFFDIEKVLPRIVVILIVHSEGIVVVGINAALTEPTFNNWNKDEGHSSSDSQDNGLSIDEKLIIGFAFAKSTQPQDGLNAIDNDIY